MRVRWAAALLLGAAGIWAAALAQTPGAGSANGPPLGDPTDGAAVYASRCSSCHDHAAGRVPSRDVISANTPTFIFSALHDGVMNGEAQGLSVRQMRDVAAYLSHNTTGDVVSHEGEAPPCADPPPPLEIRPGDWNGWGRTVQNQRFQPDPGFTAADVPRLKLKWAIAMSGDRNGQPTVVGGRLYTNNTAGTVYALNAKSGCLYWRFQAASGTRTTITVGRIQGRPDVRYALYIADRHRDVYAIDADRGALLWKTHVDDQAGALMTGSPTVYDNRLYVPVSSGEEFYAQNDQYPCCRFRGAVVALDASTGKILWKTYTVAAEPHPTGINAKGVTRYGPAGGAVWSAPTVDPKLGLLYVGTGNSYTDTPNEGSDAVLAIDMATGAIRWSQKLTPKDNYIIGCYKGQRRGANCPSETGGDYDVGDSPILQTLPGGKRLLLVGQKSSQVWAFDPDNGGRLVWTKRLSVGGSLGGVEFGPANDGERLYVGIADIFMRRAARPGVTAFEITDGRIDWQTPSPPLPCRWNNPYCDPAISQALTAIPGVVFAGAMNGRLRAYSADKGAVLWEFDTGGSFPTLSGRQAQGGVLDAAGPVAADGMVYVHSGYAGRSGSSGTVLLAFSVDGK